MKLSTATVNFLQLPVTLQIQIILSVLWVGLVQYLMSLFYRQSDRKIPDTDAEYGPDNSPG